MSLVVHIRLKRDTHPSKKSGPILIHRGDCHISMYKPTQVWSLAVVAPRWRGWRVGRWWGRYRCWLDGWRPQRRLQSHPHSLISSINQPYRVHLYFAHTLPTPCYMFSTSVSYGGSALAAHLQRNPHPQPVRDPGLLATDAFPSSPNCV